ncbi:trp RNA-binding attenuation protein MtrB [Thermosyntropha sp.]|uniref:trp RNA-binding attenuation protein MtrB n=1 Tax=Thermosyntropha sp. TaxID=2740820 RepID=UPI0025D4CA27|nr:trp RNA-binding attenuation protein MtrB [Thermosyntropha sp.]MBO8158893.1 trp RNA-binding attenuation protein MtrB [Thermosyntropha sp.]
MEHNCVNCAEADYIVVKALENGVTIIGLTRGKDTKFHHTEKLDKGEIMVLQFTEHTSAMKIRGQAEIYTRYGLIMSESSQPGKNL